jgi:hypothetical protein
MYALRFKRNIETLWPDNEVLLGDELTGFVVELPCELNHARPVV